MSYWWQPDISLKGKLIVCPEANETKETVLRKYPNRRIYDPTKNAHVTLSEIADRVKNGEKIRVVDQKTGEDLTQIIMGQVLFETLKTRPDYLPLDLVLLMIRAQDNVVRGFLQNGLPQAFQIYMESQRRMMSGMNWMNQGFQGFPNMSGGFPGMFQGQGGMGYPQTGFPGGQPTPPDSGSEALKEEMRKLRDEIDRMKQQSKPETASGSKPRATKKKSV